MAIDPSIALRVQGVEAPNPLIAYGQVAQIQNAQNQNALAQYQLGAAKRAEEQQNALNAQYAQHFDPTTGQVNIKGLLGGLAASGQGAQIPVQMAKHQELMGKEATLQKTQADIVAAQKKHLDSVAINLSFNPSNENIIAHNQDIQKGNFAPEIKTWAAKQEQILLGMKLDQRKAYLEKSGATAGDFVSAANNAATVAEQARGHNMADTRERQRIGMEAERLKLAQDEARLKREGIDNIAPKELQKREAALPAATASVKGFEKKSDSFLADLKALRDHPGLSEITGIAAGRLPGITSEGRAAQALYDKVVAKGGFQALQDLRDASKTGGALGNISNQEGKQLTASFAAIQRTQDAKDVKAAIDQAIGDVEGAKTRMREAYDSTYAYKKNQTTPTMQAEDKQALDWANSNPKDPRAAVIKQRLGVQ